MTSTEKDALRMKCQAGAPVFLRDICAIYPATLREIAEIGYDKFLLYLNLFIQPRQYLEEKTDLEKFLNSLSDFQYFIAIAETNKEIHQKIKEAFIFFIRENVIFALDHCEIIIGAASEHRVMTEDDFREFCQILRIMYFQDTEDTQDIVIYPDDPPRVKELKKQFMRNRERVARAKAKQPKQHIESEVTMSDLIGSLAIGKCGLNMLNVYDLTYYAFHDQLKRMGWRDQFDINNRAALAGAKINKKQLKYWIKPIVSKDN